MIVSRQYDGLTRGMFALGLSVALAVCLGCFGGLGALVLIAMLGLGGSATLAGWLLVFGVLGAFTFVATAVKATEF